MELSTAISTMIEHRNGIITHDQSTLAEAQDVLRRETPDWHWQQEDDGSWSIHRPTLQNMED